MSGLTGTHTVTDPQFGRLQRPVGARRGRSVLAGRDVLPLALPRGKSGPEAAALALACTLPERFQGLQPAIAAALREHVERSEEPAADADSGGQAGALGARAQPVPAGVVTPVDGALIEAGLAVDWDGEHTLGAGFLPGGLIEACGSVVAQ